jgi:hypothetical protein
MIPTNLDTHSKAAVPCPIAKQCNEGERSCNIGLTSLALAGAGRPQRIGARELKVPHWFPLKQKIVADEGCDSHLLSAWPLARYDFWPTRQIARTRPREPNPRQFTSSLCSDLISVRRGFEPLPGRHATRWFYFSLNPVNFHHLLG